jgi:hypothetical protein
MPVVMNTPAGRVTLFRAECEKLLDAQIGRAMQKTALAIENKVKQLMTGPRHGKWYRIGKTPTKQNISMGMKSGRWYQASAPGEPPAIRSSRYFHAVTHKVERESAGRWIGVVGVNLKFAGYPPALEYGIKAGGAARSLRTYRMTVKKPGQKQGMIAKVKQLTFAGGWRLAPRPLWSRAVKELQQVIVNIWRGGSKK